MNLIYTDDEIIVSVGTVQKRDFRIRALRLRTHRDSSNPGQPTQDVSPPGCHGSSDDGLH